MTTNVQARFEVWTADLLKIQVFQNAKLCRWANTSTHNKCGIQNSQQQSLQFSKLACDPLTTFKSYFYTRKSPFSHIEK
jgi:hypothetical protein